MKALTIVIGLPGVRVKCRTGTKGEESTGLKLRTAPVPGDSGAVLYDTVDGIVMYHKTAMCFK